MDDILSDNQSGGFSWMIPMLCPAGRFTGRWDSIPPPGRSLANQNGNLAEDADTRDRSRRYFKQETEAVKWTCDDMRIQPTPVGIVMKYDVQFV